jgi:hypothetical protein
MTIHRAGSTLVTAGSVPTRRACWTTTTASRTRKPTSAWAAHRYAIWALASSGIGILLAAAALTR